MAPVLSFKIFFPQIQQRSNQLDVIPKYLIPEYLTDIRTRIRTVKNESYPKKLGIQIISLPFI